MNVSAIALLGQTPACLLSCSLFVSSKLKICVCFVLNKMKIIFPGPIVEETWFHLGRV